MRSECSLRLLNLHPVVPLGQGKGYHQMIETGPLPNSHL